MWENYNYGDNWPRRQSDDMFRDCVRDQWFDWWTDRIMTVHIVLIWHCEVKTVIKITVKDTQKQTKMATKITTHEASTSTRWHFAFALCCHSNATCAPIANPPNTAQLGGILYHSPSYIQVRTVVWECSEGQTDRQLWRLYIMRRLQLTQNVIIKTRQNNTYRHIGPTASISGFGHRVNQLSTDTKVTHLYIAKRIKQNVWWLHV